MKYIVFRYTDCDAVYAVPRSDTAELSEIETLMEDYPGRMVKMGTLETEENLPQWWRIFFAKRRPDRPSPVIELLKCRNADIVFG